MDESNKKLIDWVKVGHNIQTARKAMGMTQDQLAKYFKAARTTIVAIEAGDRKLKQSEVAILEWLKFPNVFDVSGVDLKDELKPEMDNGWMKLNDTEREIIRAYRANNFKKLIRIAIQKED